MACLYVTQQGAVLRKVDERLKVTLEKETLIDVPMLKVSQVVVFGRITVTPQTLESLLNHGVEVCYLTEHGRFIGRGQPQFSKNSILRKKQYEAAFDKNKTLAIARYFVSGKLANMRVMLVRAARARQDGPENREDGSQLAATAEEQGCDGFFSEAIARLKRAERLVLSAESLDALRGYEGEGSSAYFASFGALIKNADFSFERRVRRPPTDPINSLLSFGYTLLANDINSAVNVVGLDPYVGYLHNDKYGKPSLVLDLMEEFRPLIVDSVVLTCTNKSIISPDDFEVGLGDVYKLKDDARRKFLLQYEERKNTEFKHPIFRYKVTYKRAFEMQARLLAKYLTGEIPKYPPVITK